MSTQTHTSRTPLKPRRMLAGAWRAWWLRAVHRRQLRQLDQVLLDPHMARDLGLPARERPTFKPGLF